MFNLGLPELLVIGAAGLLLFGPKRLPELGKSLGKGIRDFKKALDGEEETPAPPKVPEKTEPAPTSTAGGDTTSKPKT